MLGPGRPFLKQFPEREVTWCSAAVQATLLLLRAGKGAWACSGSFLTPSVVPGDWSRPAVAVLDFAPCSRFTVSAEGALGQV